MVLLCEFFIKFCVTISMMIIYDALWIFCIFLHSIHNIALIVFLIFVGNFVLFILFWYCLFIFLNIPYCFKHWFRYFINFWHLNFFDSLQRYQTPKSLIEIFIKRPFGNLVLKKDCKGETNIAYICSRCYQPP